MAETIKAEELSGKLQMIFKAYDAGAVEVIDEAAEKTAKRVNEEIKAHVTFKTHPGGYVDHFEVMKDESKTGPNKRVWVWHVKAPEYRKTHLLEKGHALRNGGRAAKFPHIKFGATLAKTLYLEEIEKGFKNL